MRRCEAYEEEQDRRWEKSHELSAHQAFVWRSTDTSAIDPEVVPYLRAVEGPQELAALADIHADAFAPLEHVAFLKVAERLHGVAMMKAAGLSSVRRRLAVVRCAQPEIAPATSATTAASRRPEVSTILSACS